MRTSLDCMACFVRQALDAARMASDDPSVHQRVVRQLLRRAADMDMDKPPPASPWLPSVTEPSGKRQTGSLPGG